MQPFLSSYRSTVKAFKALKKFISINVINFQFSNFTKNSTIQQFIQLMTVSVVEPTKVNVMLKVIVIVPSKILHLSIVLYVLKCTLYFK